MATSTPNKTVGRLLLAHTQLASGSLVVGASLDASSWHGPALVTFSLGRTVSTALGASPLFRIEHSQAASGDDDWADLIPQGTIAFSATTAATATTLNGATSANAATFSVASATGLVVGQRLYLRETGTPANSEWCQIRSISGTTITPVDPLTRAHTNGITITTLAERITHQIDLSAVRRVRAIVEGQSFGTASGQIADVLVELATMDSITST